MLRVVGGSLAASFFHHGSRLLQLGGKNRRAVEPRQRVHDLAVRIQNVVDTVAGDGTLQRAPVSKINGHSRRRAYRFPMQDESILQGLVNFCAGIERGTEEAAFSPPSVFIYSAPHAQPNDILP